MLGRRDGHRVGRGVEEHRGDVDARDAVDQRVMGLGEQREAAGALAAEALHQPDLPQRLGAVEALGEDAAGQALELLRASGRGQGGVTQVVARVEVGVIDPHRAALLERHEGEALAVARHEVQAALDGRDDVVVVGDRALEGHARGDVHVRAIVLEVEEGGVEPREAIGGHPRILTYAPCRAT